MVYVVDKESESILFRIDAWDADALKKARKFIEEKVLYVIDKQITFNGDMVIWVR